MTEATQIALRQAADALTTARVEADREKAACLAQIAADLPSRAADSAKRVATAQPDVTKSLGKDGIAQMRAELDDAAEELGRQFVGALGSIKWPPLGMVHNVDIHSVLFDRFWQRTGSLSKVMTDHGYDLRGVDPFIPQALYDQSKFTPLATALIDLAVATDEYQKAKRADDDASVDDLWG